ncbi:MAG TPA: hypothetical protein VMF86_15105 [Stellaceae bacterium]|nr:hypothetical protein [Stellaceae bacterium]
MTVVERHFDEHSVLSDAHPVLLRLGSDDDRARCSKQQADAATQPDRFEIARVHKIGQRRIAKIDPDLGAACGGDDREPLRVRNRVEGLGERYDRRRKECRRKPGAPLLRGPPRIEAGIFEPCVDDALQRSAEAHRNDDRQCHGHRNAVEAPPPPHGEAPEAETGTAK